MPRPIQHRARFGADADTVHATLVDADYLHARLSELGGKDSSLQAHEVDGDTARVALRQGVPVEFLPSVIRRFTGDDLVLDRAENWGPRPGGGWRADVEVTVRGLPGSIVGTQEVTDTAQGSELVLSGTTTVPVPMVGGRIEGTVAEQVTELLGFESEFTRRWLGEG
jgi:hypothetical protein